ncbi:hypothetical protein [Pseudomonas viridiflava]|uniref:hypothetical protein n=1 Tax=Pseudomonas viridiflava TaxID=33069 RepID=UPI0013CF3F02|nr:hypothetical protein [Pseudomonas viridiflava]
MGGEANERRAENPAIPTLSIPPSTAHERDGSHYIGQQNKHTPETVKSNRRRKYEAVILGAGGLGEQRQVF